MLGVEMPTVTEVADFGQIKLPGIHSMNPCEAKTVEPKPGQFTRESGLISMQCIKFAAESCRMKLAQAMVTAPISKEAVNLAGYQIPGHTEYLQEIDKASDVAMMLVSGNLRVVPLSTHIPLSAVPKAVTKSSISLKTSIISGSLRRDFGISKPRIAVLGLNPHAGDGGVIGMEEIETIVPAIAEAKKNGIDVHGPFPADGFFATGAYTNYDVILSMYHDQGLIPFKTLTFNKGVNLTAGLSFIRTSPDHGTAFGIAGKGLANPASCTQAINMAIRLAENRINE